MILLDEDSAGTERPWPGAAAWRRGASFWIDPSLVSRAP